MLGVIVALLVSAAPLESDPAFRAAQARYDDFEFADARERFEALLKRKLDDETRARVLVWIGMCDAEDGALSDAATAFDEAATWDPDVKPLPTMSPKARRMLDEARVRARARLAAADDGADADADADQGGAPVEPPPVGSSGPASPSPLVVAGGVGLGVGALGGIAGGVVGAVAAAAADESARLDDAALATKRYADANNLALAANVALGAAAVVGVVGAVCLVVGLSVADDLPEEP